jgi:hypothetical protein
MLAAIRRASSRNLGGRASARLILEIDIGEDLVCSRDHAAPDRIVSAMLLSLVALLFGLGIGVIFSGGLSDIITTLADLRAAAHGALAH